MILQTLHHPAVDLARTVSMLIAKIASIDVPSNEWPDLVEKLLENMAGVNPSSSLRQATLETLGYICEELADLSSISLPQDLVNKILTAVVQGMLKDEKDNEVRLAATRALINALEFAHTNFTNENERNFIMQVVCEGTCCHSSSEIREASYECLVSICQRYYEHLPPYMNEIFRLSVQTIQKDEEEVSKLAVEFWCTLADEEIEVMEDIEEQGADDSLVIHYLIKQAFPTLVPLLLNQLTKQEDDQELEETAWTVAMAAGTCIDLIAICVGNDIVPVVLEFCKHYLEKLDTPDSWRQREAATYALGLIMDGCRSHLLVEYVQNKFQYLLRATKDPDPRVRNTTAWTIGRIFEFLVGRGGSVLILNEQSLTEVVTTLLQSLGDEPHIANRVCFALSQLAMCTQQLGMQNFSQHFKNIVQALIHTAFRKIDDRFMQSKLQISAFEAINDMVKGCPDDCIHLVVQLVPLFTQKLQESMNLDSNVNQDDKERLPEMQGMLCGCLGVLFRRLELNEKQTQVLDLSIADYTMEVLLTLFQSNARNSTVHEEAMMAVGTLTFAVKTHFGRYLEKFMPFLEIGLRSHREVQVCISTIGTFGNICNAVGELISPYCDPIMDILISSLQSDEVNRDIKPHILSVLSDIALAIGDEFGKYLNVVATILKSAVDLSIAGGDTIDDDFNHYNNELRRAILEAYSGILQGVGPSAADKCLHQQSQYMIDFLERVVNEAPRDEYMTTTAVGLLGDIAHAIPSLVRHISQKPWVTDFLKVRINIKF